MTDDGAVGESRHHRSTTRSHLPNALLTLGTGLLILCIGIVWWRHPPAFDALSIREHVLRCLDAVFVILTAGLWIILPFVGLLFLWGGGLVLARLALAGVRERRLQVLARRRARRLRQEQRARVRRPERQVACW